MQSYELQREQAGSIMSLFMIATAVGSLAIGYLSDKFWQVRFMLGLSCVARCALFLSIAPFVIGNRWSTIPSLTVFTLGFIGGGTVPLLLKSMRQIYGVETIGTGSSLNATLGA
jgi:MFS family permease